MLETIPPHFTLPSFLFLLQSKIGCIGKRSKNKLQNHVCKIFIDLYLCRCVVGVTTWENLKGRYFGFLNLFIHESDSIITNQCNVCLSVSHQNTKTAKKQSFHLTTDIQLVLTSLYLFHFFSKSDNYRYKVVEGLRFQQKHSPMDLEEEYLVWK